MVRPRSRAAAALPQRRLRRHGGSSCWCGKRLAGIARQQSCARSHDCCCSRCASVDVLAGITCAPSGWSCASTHASALFQPPVLPDSSGARCCSPGASRPRSSPRVCAYGFVAFRRGACRVLGLSLRVRDAIMGAHDMYVSVGYGLDGVDGAVAPVRAEAAQAREHMMWSIITSKQG